MRISNTTLANLFRLAADLYGGKQTDRTRIAGPIAPGALSSYGQNTDNLDSSSISHPIELSDTTATYQSDARGASSVDPASRPDGELGLHIVSKRSLNDNIASGNLATVEPSSRKTKSWEKLLSDQQKEYLKNTEFELKESLRKAIISDLHGGANTDPERIFNDMLNAYDFANRNYHDLEFALNPLLHGWNSTRNAVERLSKTHEELREPIKNAAAMWFENRYPSHGGALIGPEAPSDKDLLDAAGRVSEDIKQKEQRLSDIHQFYSRGNGIRGIYGYDFDRSNVNDLGQGTVTFNNLGDALRFGPRGTEEQYPKYLDQPSINMPYEYTDEVLLKVNYHENSLNKNASIKKIEYAHKKWYSFFEETNTVMLGPERYSTDGGDTWQWYNVRTSDAEEALKRRMLDEVMNQARIEVPYNLPPIDFGRRRRELDIPRDNTGYTPMQQEPVSAPSEQGTMDANRFTLPQSGNQQGDAAQPVTDQSRGQSDSTLYNLPNVPDVKNQPETLQAQAILQDQPKIPQISVQEPDRNPSVILQDQSQNSQVQSQLPRSNEQLVTADPQIRQVNYLPYAAQQASPIANPQTVAPSLANAANALPTPGLTPALQMPTNAHPVPAGHSQPTLDQRAPVPSR